MPKLLYLVTEDWAFCQHFLPMARAARASGFEVVVATRIREHAARIEAEGARVVSLENERRSFGVMEALRSILRMIKIVRREQPDIVHCIAIRMVVLGGLAARLAGAKGLILAPTGLGHLWIENGVVERVARALTRLVVTTLRGTRTQFLFENPDDPRALGFGPESPDVTFIGGAGVDATDFPPSAEPPPPVKAAIVSRMLKPKGIAEAVEAVRKARQSGAPVELHLFGSPDPSNRTTFTLDDLKVWAGMDGIHWHGPTAGAAKVWREHHIAMLLSYREGLPRSLVEAAASARPIIATDVPGCREVVRDGIEGILVPRGDIDLTARALIRLAGDPSLRQRMGEAAHARFESRFTEEKVKETVTELYRKVLANEKGYR